MQPTIEHEYYSYIISEVTRTIQLWNRIDGKFLGSILLDEDMNTWTPFYATGIDYLPINWAVEILISELLNGGTDENA